MIIICISKAETLSRRHSCAFFEVALERIDKYNLGYYRRSFPDVGDRRHFVVSNDEFVTSGINDKGT